MTELEQACEKGAHEYLKIKPHIMSITEVEKKIMFFEGFYYAMQPKNMKHTEEVKGLIEVVNKAKHDTTDLSLFSELAEALKPFEKDQK